MDLQFHSECCWSCPADIGSDRAKHEKFWCPHVAWVWDQVLFKRKKEEDMFLMQMHATFCTYLLEINKNETRAPFYFHVTIMYYFVLITKYPLPYL